LEVDSRYQSPELSSETKERLFREHTKSVMELRMNEFMALLQEQAQMGNIGLDKKEYDSIKEYIREDPRYERVHREDKKPLYDRFLRDLKRSAFNDFRELLKESKNIGHITSKSNVTKTKFDNLKNLMKVDKRYAALDVFADEREKELVSFIEELQK